MPTIEAYLFRKRYDRLATGIVQQLLDELRREGRVVELDAAASGGDHLYGTYFIRGELRQPGLAGVDAFDPVVRCPCGSGASVCFFHSREEHMDVEVTAVGCMDCTREDIISLARSAGEDRM